MLLNSLSNIVILFLDKETFFKSSNSSSFIFLISFSLEINFKLSSLTSFSKVLISSNSFSNLLLFELKSFSIEFFSFIKKCNFFLFSSNSSLFLRINSSIFLILSFKRFTFPKLLFISSFLAKYSSCFLEWLPSKESNSSFKANIFSLSSLYFSFCLSLNAIKSFIFSFCFNITPSILCNSLIIDDISLCFNSFESSKYLKALFFSSSKGPNLSS